MIVANNNINMQQVHEVYRLPYNKYIQDELYNYNACLGGELTTSQLRYAKRRLEDAINPNNIYNKFQFLDVGRFRNISKAGLSALLDREGVFKGHSLDFIDAARKYNLDPLYFVSQSAVETHWGTSNFARGVTINEIADKSKPIYSNGNLVGYHMIKLDKPVKVYNLFGVGAFDSNSNFPNKTEILGTTYAYNMGWTTVSKAIYGAAQFLAVNYVHGGYFQNTPYKLRYINGTKEDLWHQYCSDIDYSKTIARIIRDNANLYIDKDSLNFIIPEFNEIRVSNKSNDNSNLKFAHIDTGGGSLLFRFIPSRNGKVIRSIPNKSTVTVLRRSGRWVKIKYRDDIGWVRSEYIKN